MRFHLCAVGRRVPAWVDQGFADYARRLPGGARLELHPVASARGSDDPARARAEEGRRLRAAVPARAHRVALDVGGRGLSTADLVGRARAWNRTGGRGGVPRRRRRGGSRARCSTRSRSAGRCRR
ncbi:MAG: 23S rRNA (pseudouridine(1915)-N(3))-methyltransferase RlmH [Halofilum sp. (in: g-proteobacteria)]|nr:23S rRNA (pseudouridine(1915)-N(3))-methyltransferase RlmH [Halofilum sp. (in: g-proteobacteria)]